MKPILGVDPGLATTGYSFLSPDATTVKWSGRILTDKGQTDIERLYSLRNAMTALIRTTLEENPDGIEVAIEDFVFQKRKVKGGDEVPLKTAEALNRAVQVIVCVCWDHDIHPELYSAPTVKEAMTGYKRAKKKDVERSLNLRLKQMPTNNHAVDAAAVALYHANVLAMNRAMAGSRR
jgi:Holliday junction resolvasome RuvABC endonuclease subunit